MTTQEERGKRLALRRRAEHHTVTFWHAQIVICTDGAPGGGWWEEAVRCTHNHITPAAAEQCANTIGAAVERGQSPTWVVPLHEPRPGRFR